MAAWDDDSSDDCDDELIGQVEEQEGVPGRSQESGESEATKIGIKKLNVFTPEAPIDKIMVPNELETINNSDYNLEIADEPLNNVVRLKGQSNETADLDEPNSKYEYPPQANNVNNRDVNQLEDLERSDENNEKSDTLDAIDDDSGREQQVAEASTNLDNVRASDDFGNGNQRDNISDIFDNKCQITNLESKTLERNVEYTTEAIEMPNEDRIIKSEESFLTSDVDKDTLNISDSNRKPDSKCKMNSVEGYAVPKKGGDYNHIANEKSNINSTSQESDVSSSKRDSSKHKIKSPKTQLDEDQVSKPDNKATEDQSADLTIQESDVPSFKRDSSKHKIKSPKTQLDEDQVSKSDNKATEDQSADLTIQESDVSSSKRDSSKHKIKSPKTQLNEDKSADSTFHQELDASKTIRHLKGCKRSLKSQLEKSNSTKTSEKVRKDAHNAPNNHRVERTKKNSRIHKHIENRQQVKINEDTTSNEQGKQHSKSTTNLRVARESEELEKNKDDGSLQFSSSVVASSLKQSLDKNIINNPSLNNLYNSMRSKMSSDSIKDMFHKSASSTHSMFNSGMKIVDNLLNIEKQESSKPYESPDSATAAALDPHRSNAAAVAVPNDPAAQQGTRKNRKSSTRATNDANKESSNVKNTMDFSKQTFVAKFDSMHGQEILNYIVTANKLWSMSQKEQLNALREQDKIKSIFITKNSKFSAEKIIAEDFEHFDDTVLFETDYSKGSHKSIDNFKAVFHEFCDILMIDVEIETWFDDWYNFDRLMTLSCDNVASSSSSPKQKQQHHVSPTMINPYDRYLHNLAIFVISNAKVMRCLCDNFMLTNSQLVRGAVAKSNNNNSSSSRQRQQQQLQFKQIESYLRRMFVASNDVLKFLGQHCYLLFDELWGCAAERDHEMKLLQTQILFEIYNAREKILEIFKLVEPFVILYR
ncbi:MAG: hypothetical protein MHMPM18_001828 [Marteilia pararefringens]